ncbi:ribosome biogenesis protein tsr1 [Clavulina sp. PMI_390]|nr:ribosome biogenesis protein tsr1 [Clavulina sp. PMI_390]
MSTTVHHHRPTLKQQNKAFKSKHATKSSLREAAKGKVQRVSVKSSGSPTAAQNRANRRNAAKQLQLKKRHDLVEATRIFSGSDGAPRIVAVIPLCQDVSASDAVRAMLAPVDIDTTSLPRQGVWRTKVDRFKSNIQFVLLPYRNLYAALDACKAADYVVFVLSTVTEVDEWGDMALRSLQGQGLPEVTTVALAESEQKESKQSGDILKSLLSFIRYFVPTQQRVYELTASSDAINAIRSVCEGRPSAPKWRDGRSWVLADSMAWEESPPMLGETAKDPLGVLTLTGVVRGGSLSANRLVHIPNAGDFQIEQILSSPNSSRRHKEAASGGMDVEPQVLSERTNDGDSLTSRLDPDTMQNEQTWPTEEEMQGVDGASTAGPTGSLPPASIGTTPKAVKKVRVPKGTSAYQAAWIVDDAEDGDGEDWEDYASDDEEIDNEAFKVPEPIEPADDEEVDFDDSASVSTRKSVAFEDLDMEEEGRQLDDWRAKRAREREDKDDLEFPDELDTPQDIAARTRFQRFRGLRSFRTSPWDPYENLPIDYSRIFQFEDYERTKRRVRKQADEEGVQPGTLVSVRLKNVPRSTALDRPSSNPVMLFSLLQHEHKYSVLNFSVQRNTEHTGSVRSKDPMVICVGPRRYRTNPIYSDNGRGGSKGANNVHKFERYLRHGTSSVATIYGPIVFGKQPCLVLRETGDYQAPELVATGTFMNPDPKRIIAKRIILTGHPFKVHKKTATIRYMFFNPEDVSYFAPIQLHTKHGRTGHISESLGTHGYFKAHFDGPINQMDTVCLSLYKRVFPRWAELHRIAMRKDDEGVAGEAMEE